jgi:hypothetical protein
MRHDCWHPNAPGSDVPAFNYSRPVGFRRRRGFGQYSMTRVKNGVIPALRTGLTVTLPALPDASSI